MPRTLYPSLLLTFFLIGSTVAHAEIYKWVDANGTTHYGDKAPQSRQSQTLNLGELSRPSAPKKPISNNNRISFPGRPLKTNRGTSPMSQARFNTQTLAVKKVQSKSKRPSTKSIASLSIPPSTYAAKPTKTKAVKSDKTKLVHSDSIEKEPDLDADVYDLRKQQKEKTQNVKLKLCNEKRMLLAALRESGFAAYYNEDGHYRLAWGGDGIYQGKRRYLSDSEVTKKRSDVMYQVEQYCDTPYDKGLQETARANWIRGEYCTLSKAVLEDLEHPFMRASDDRIAHQAEEVKRFCATLAPGRYRHDRRYYPQALQPKVILPRSLTVKEDNTEITAKNSTETLEQLLARIE